MKIQRLLIANRGEIALRIARTARRLGISTIGVYSSVDRNAMHVHASDEAILLGDAPPAESYLNIDKIIDAAVACRADAIHAGYGFLAENADFARRCAENNIIFVGPPPAAINLMGLKGQAREKMIEAGVPVLPGIDHVQSDDIQDQVAAIGYPVLIKPEAGGGGKGMKIVREAAGLTEALQTSRREALSSFNDDRLMVEKYLDAPRHIEIQVFADSQGNCIHLNERDCSLQRRHQKIVEESPAPAFKASLREAMGQAAVTAARAIGYEGAGTVEFLLAPDDSFYFMEMNTRLQVEHPVTEAVTGFDLVAWQLTVAAGEPLPATQDDVPIRGHAMEARIYAEDPLNNFLPASGRIQHLELPTESPALRIDNGVGSGDLVGVFYDPMLMKLIARGEDRASATDHLRRSVQQLHLAGIKTNRDFLLAVLGSTTFQTGAVTTNWLDECLHETLHPVDRDELHLAICGVIMYLLEPGKETTRSPWDSAHSFRLNQDDQSRLLIIAADEEYWTELAARGKLVVITVAGKTSRCQMVAREPLEFIANGETHNYSVIREGTHVTVFTPTRVIELQLPDDISRVHEDEQGNVQAPMSGKIVSVMVKEGDSVARGTPLITIEAMKMEHTVYAPADGSIESIFFVEQDLVNEGMELLEFVASDQ